MYNTKIGREDQYKNLLINSAKIVEEFKKDPMAEINNMVLYVPKPKLSDKIRILDDLTNTHKKLVTGSGKISTTYQKQYPVIGGNGRRNMEYRGGVKTAKPIYKMETMSNTIDKPLKVDKIVEGSIIVDNFKKNVEKNQEKAKLLSSEIVKEKPITIEGNEPLLLEGGGKSDKMQRRQKLVKLVMKQQNMSLGEASNFIKTNKIKY
jgi:hypothetical protein